MKSQFYLKFVVIVFALFFAGCANNEPTFVLRGKTDKKSKSTAVPYSEEIPKEVAKNMRRLYKDSKNNFKTKYFDTNGKIVLGTLEGFAFDASDLEILIKDANGKKAKSIAFYFARDINDIVHEGKTYPSYAIIAMGIDSTGKLAQTAYDKADPCPPYCPDEN